MGEKETFYLVRADILPESFLKTIQVKKLLEQEGWLHRSGSSG